MKITKIIAKWEDGSTYSIDEEDVTTLLTAGGNEGIQQYLLLAFATNLAGGLNWIKHQVTDKLLLPDEEIIKLIVAWRKNAEKVSPDNPSLALDVADLAKNVADAQLAHCKSLIEAHYEPLIEQAKKEVDALKQELEEADRYIKERHEDGGAMHQELKDLKRENEELRQRRQ